MGRNSCLKSSLAILAKSDSRLYLQTAASLVFFREETSELVSGDSDKQTHYMLHVSTSHILEAN